METSEKTVLEEIQGTLQEILQQFKKMVREGNAKKVIVKNRNGKTLLESRLTLGVAGTAVLAVYAPLFTAISALVLYASNVRVFVEKDADETSDEYEVDAEVIDIEDESDDDSDKTVGKE